MKWYSFLWFLVFPCLYVQAQTYTLSQVLKEVLENNLEVRVADISVSRAKLAHHPGFAGMLPRLEVDGILLGSQIDLRQEFTNGQTVEQDGVISNQVNAFARLGYTLFDGLAMFHLYARLGKEADLAGIQRLLEVERLAGEAFDLFYSLLRIQQQEILQTRVVEAARYRAEIAEKRFRTGSDSRQEWVQARIDLKQYEVRGLELRAQAEQQLATLNRLMAREPDASFVCSTDTILPGVSDYSNWRDLALGQNLGLKEISLQQEIVRLERKQLRGSYLPQLDVFGDYTFAQTRNTAGFFLLNQNAGLSYNFTFRMNLFNGFQVRQTVRMAGMELQRLQARETAMQLEIRERIWQAWRVLSKERERYDLAIEIIELAGENLSIAQSRYANGITNSLPLREAELSLIEAGFLRWDAYYAVKRQEMVLLKEANLLLQAAP
jgi:outer membrane protein